MSQRPENEIVGMGQSGKHRGPLDELEQLRLLRMAREEERRAQYGSGEGGRHALDHKTRRLRGSPGFWEKVAGVLGSRWFGWLGVAVLLAVVGGAGWYYVSTGGDAVKNGGGNQAGQTAGPEPGSVGPSALHGASASASAQASVAASASALASKVGSGGLGAQLRVLAVAPSAAGLGAELTGCWQGGLTAHTNVVGKWTLLVAWRAAGAGGRSAATMTLVKIRSDAGTQGGAGVLEAGPGAGQAPVSAPDPGGSGGLVRAANCQLVGAWQGWL